MPIVATLAPQMRTVDGKLSMLDGVTVVDTVRRLEVEGANVIGLNCARGPDTMLPLLEEIKGVCKVS